MIEIRGLYNTALCYTSALEEKAAEQIRTVCDQEEFAGCRIRIMPDVHAGKGCTIGTTMTISDKVVPGMVGVDIGCGMETVRLAEREIDFAALDALIRREVPSGRNVRGGEHPFNAEIDLSELRCAHSVSLDWARRSIGTLGGGNHFIEIDRAAERRAVSCCPLRQPLSRHAGLRVLSGAGTACPAPRRAGAGQRADRRVSRRGTAAGDPLGAQRAGRRARETHPQRSRLCGRGAV